MGSEPCPPRSTWQVQLPQPHRQSSCPCIHTWPGYFRRMFPVPLWAVEGWGVPQCPVALGCRLWGALCTTPAASLASGHLVYLSPRFSKPGELIIPKPLVISQPSVSVPLSLCTPSCRASSCLYWTSLLMKIQAVLSQITCAHTLHTLGSSDLWKLSPCQLQPPSLAGICLLNTAFWLWWAPGWAQCGKHRTQTKPQQQQTLQLPLL